MKSSRSFEEGSRASNHVTNRSKVDTPFQFSPPNSLESSIDQPSNDSSIEQRSSSTKCDPDLFQEDRLPQNTIGNLEQPVPGLNYASLSENTKLSDTNKKLPFPDFSHSINTNFTMANNDLIEKSEDSPDACHLFQEGNASATKITEQCNKAFNFTKFEKLMENQIERRELMSTSLPNNMLDADGNWIEGEQHNARASGGCISCPLNDASIPRSVWAMDVCDGLLALGCSNGRIELWETFSGTFKVL